MRSGKRYGECPRKAEARRVTVFEAFRQATGLKSVPAGRQYWALCGPMADGRRGLQENCELLAAVGSGIVSPRQFVGAERDAAVLKANMDAVMRAMPAGRRPRFVLGDVADALEQSLFEGTLRPGLVNLDTINEPGPGATLLARSLHSLNHVDGPVVVVWNTILRGRWRKHSWADVSKIFSSHPSLPAALDGWEQFPRDGAWTYGGTGSSAVTMGTIALVRKASKRPLPRK